MAPTRKIYALKRIRLTGRDSEAAAGFIDEITLLQRLRNKPNIIPAHRRGGASLSAISQSIASEEPC